VFACPRAFDTAFKGYSLRERVAKVPKVMPAAEMNPKFPQYGAKVPMCCVLWIQWTSGASLEDIFTGPEPPHSIDEFLRQWKNAK
jgi:hypothetical protein